MVSEIVALAMALRRTVIEDYVEAWSDHPVVRLMQPMSCSAILV